MVRDFLRNIMNNNITLNTVTITNGAIKEFYEFCQQGTNSNQGINPTFSLCLVANEMLLRESYDKICGMLYDQSKDKDVQEYYKLHNELVFKFADRDNNGEIIKEQNGNPKITEMLVEFENESNALDKKYEEAIKKRDEGFEKNNQVLATASTLKVFNCELEQIPSNLPPRLVSYFASNVIKELFNK